MTNDLSFVVWHLHKFLKYKFPFPSSNVSLSLQLHAANIWVSGLKNFLLLDSWGLLMCTSVVIIIIRGRDSKVTTTTATAEFIIFIWHLSCYMSERCFCWRNRVSKSVYNISLTLPTNTCTNEKAIAIWFLLVYNS